jgi:hypothetical protein
LRVARRGFMASQPRKRVGILRQARQGRSRVTRRIRVECGDIDGVATGALRLSEREIVGLLLVRGCGRDGIFLVLESLFQAIDAFEESLEDVCFRAALFRNRICTSGRRWRLVWRVRRWECGNRPSGRDIRAVRSHHKCTGFGRPCRPRSWDGDGCI